ncbi:hypothetical protein KFZ76_12975 [Methylovulum psychrotolerans]|uniref:beta strand repeat-containing protein n=1 Tax=Methylovulum psychrotolerans TaxID=1704499 RepID=UPI001BFF8FC7|nr:calcium-binding protein [Methylovulum psychrotolerans]MBT9098614.1 hypothetical protein [Methylovulum psychrotolerans]
MTILKGTNNNDVLNGTDSDDTIYGLGGNDTLNGLGGNDILDGGNGNDILLGGDGNDSLLGGAGNDILDTGNGYSETVDGGTGIDTLSINEGNTGGGYGLNYQMWDSGGNFIFDNGWNASFGDIHTALASATQFNVYWEFNGVHSTYFTNVENVNLSGSGNNDLLIAQGKGIYNGGDGTDTLYADWSAATNNIVFNNDPSQTVAANGSTFSSVERLLVTTGSGDDNLSNAGNPGYNDVFDLGAGNDTLSINEGNTGGNYGLNYQMWDSGGGFIFDNGWNASFGDLHTALATATQFNVYWENGGVRQTYFTNVENVNLSGSGNNDLLIARGVGSYNGGDGIDTLYADWSGASKAIIWQNDPSKTQKVNGGTISGIERLLVTTGSGDDNLSNAGNPGYNDVFDLGAGNDTLSITEGNTGGNAGFIYQMWDASNTLLFDQSWNASFNDIRTALATATQFNVYWEFNGVRQTYFTNVENVNLSGSGNNDLLIAQGNGSYNGGDGTDTLYADWSGVSKAIIWQNDPSKTQNVNGGTMSGIERLLVTTGSGDDSLSNAGNPGFNDVFDLGAGNDTLSITEGNTGGNAGFIYQMWDASNTLLFDQSWNASFNDIRTALATATQFNVYWEFNGVRQTYFTNVENVNLSGSGNNDLLIAQGNGSYNGGDGTDTLYADWSGVSKAIIWQNDPSKTQNVNGGTMSGIERLLVTTGSGDDSLSNAGNPGFNDVFDLGAGNDTLSINEGNTGGNAGFIYQMWDASNTLLFDQSWNASFNDIRTALATATQFNVYWEFNGVRQTYFTNVENVNLSGSGNNDLLIAQGNGSYNGGDGTDTLYADWSGVSKAIIWQNDPSKTQNVNGGTMSGIERLLVTTGSGDDSLSNAGNPGFNDVFDLGAGNDTLSINEGNTGGNAGFIYQMWDASNTLLFDQSWNASFNDIRTALATATQFNVYWEFNGVRQTYFTNVENVNLSGSGNNDLLIAQGNGSYNGGDGTDTLYADWSGVSKAIIWQNDPSKTQNVNGGTMSGIERLLVTTGSGDDSLSNAGNPGFNDVFDLGAGNDTLSINEGNTGGNAGFIYQMWDASNTLLFDQSWNASFNDIRTALATATQFNVYWEFNGVRQTYFTNVENVNLSGSGNNDLLIAQGNGSYNGGDGTDTLYADWSGVSKAIIWQNDPSKTQNVNGGTMSGIERLLVTTGSGDDSLSNAGNPGFNDVFDLGAGNDTLSINEGNTGGNAGFIYQMWDASNTLLFDQSWNASFNDIRTALATATQFNVYWEFNGVRQTYFTNVENVNLSGSGNNDLLIAQGVGSLHGNDGNDTLYADWAGATGNYLDGGTGADTMVGSMGNDTFVVDNSLDIVIENTNAGTDTVLSSITYTLGANLENLNLLGVAKINGTGNALDNVLIGNGSANTLNGAAGNDRLDGGLGADSLKGGSGDDLYSVDNVGDIVVETTGQGTDTVNSSITYTLGANVENLTLTGNAAINGTGNELDNSLIGNSADNRLDGGTGADSLKGGLGNDVYIVDNTGDTVTENANEGTDTVQSAITRTLGANLENLTLTGTATINGIGNSLANTLIGNAANNILNGSTGADTLKGGVGNDLYIVDNVGDTVTENSGEGTDTVQASVSYTLAANIENLTLTGSANINGRGNDLANTLIGNSGNNILDGGTGADSLQGGLGDDSYIVDNSADTVVENSGAGTDTVQASVSYTLAANVENLILTGTAISGFGNGLANTITGNASGNQLDGGAGADTLIGGAGDDVYTVDNAADTVVEASGAGLDTVLAAVSYTLAANVEYLTLMGNNAIDGTGNDLANTLTGNAAANVLDGGTGADSLVGGLGNDIYIVDNAGDVITEASGEGTDLILSSVTRSLGGVFVENLTLTGAAAINGTGNSFANVLIGNAAANVLDAGAGNDTVDGGAGADTLKGGTGNDLFVVDNVGDTVIENAGEGTDTVQASVSYGLAANVENLTLTGAAAINGTGNDLANTLIGNTAANVLDGGMGADILKGGAGDDTYLVDNSGDSVVEASGEGTDTVQASVTYTLAGNVENLTLSGTAAINGTGNDLANLLVGNSADNRLDGGTGADSLQGGLGNDVYVVDNTGDTVTENANEGTDSVQSAVTWALAANLENLTLTGTAASNGIGNSQANTLLGNAAANTLNGGGGADTLIGGLGNDLYTVDNSGDSVSENSGEGTDTVQSSITYSLGANVENLILNGAAVINGTGNGLANVLTGNAAANTLDGGAGNDTLNGGAGADSLIGGLGDDTFVVDNSADTVSENGGEGTDTVQAAITYTLTANVENLILSGSAAINGTGNSQANTLIGNTAANSLDGGAGDDWLDGGTGADTLIGGLGDDTFIVDNSTDSVMEASGEGTDSVQASVTYTLAADVENLTLTGSKAVNGTGNGLANGLTGNSAANILDGGLGDDLLNGGAGADTLTGGLGSDTFVFDTLTGGADKILDFVSGTDRLQLSDGSAGLNIGNGDHSIGNAELINGHGGFSTASELVIVTPAIIGTITAGKAATDIGSAAGSYAVGDTRLFAVDNGVDSALYLFKSAGADAGVSASELTLLGILQGTAQTALADYVFA